MSARLRRYLVVAAVLAVLATAAGLLTLRHAAVPACGGTPVLLITVDTLRADALSVLGSRVATPQIDALAHSGALFGQAVTATPLTGPSHATILTGLYPNRHAIRDNGQVLRADQPGLAAWLGACGYVSGGFVSGFPLHHQFGFDRGFAHYDDNFAAAANNPFAQHERRAEDTVRAALSWTGTRSSPKWFAWVHLYDPHTPYTAPPAFHQGGENGAYLAEVAYTDHWIGELVRSVRERYPDAIVVLTSDHGEGLGEHGEYDHGLLLYQSTLRVPLIVSAPGQVPVQQQATPVRTADIAPTVLALAGVAVPPGLDGIDLAPALRSAAAPALLPAYSESYFGAYTYGWAPLQALRDGDWKRIQGARSEVFELSTDPQETTPRSDAVAAARDARLESLLATVPQPQRPPPSASDALSAEATARLRSLGYLSAGSPDTPARWRNDVDPRDRLAEHAAVLQAQQALDSSRWAEAETRLRALVADHPDNRVAWLRLGSLLMAKRDVEGGLLSLTRAVELDTENPETRYQLAEALLRARRYAAAADAWAEVTRRQPQRAVAWSNFGAALLLDGRTDAAIGALEQAVALSPKAANLRENLAQAQLRGGRRDAAITSLRQQAELQGDAFPLAALLAAQLAGKGERDEAAQWLSRARPDQDSYAEAQLALAVAWAGDDKPRARTYLHQALAAKPQLRDAIAAAPELTALLDPPQP